MRQLMVSVFIICLLVLVPQMANASDWYFKPSKNNQPATTEPEYKALLEKYHGVWIGDTNKKIIYFTFDCGYENGYTDDVLDILKKEKVPGAFFITGHYIKSQPDLVKRMVDEGHVVGNHSWGHPDLSKISDERYTKEIKKLEKYYTKLTGKHDMKYLRPPRGTFNERSLRLAEQLGYTSVFWSFAYQDWLTNQQRGQDFAYNSIMKRVHPGAILLLHTVSKDNALALERVIDDLRKKDYKFESLDYLLAHQAAPHMVW